MHPFLIYIIVLLTVYSLYYGFLITFDLTAKKREDKKEEIVDTSDMSAQITSRMITENADGGYSIGNSDTSDAPQPAEDIEEADEQTAGFNSVEDPEEGLEPDAHEDGSRTSIGDLFATDEPQPATSIPETECEREQVEEYEEGVTHLAFNDEDSLTLSEPAEDDETDPFDESLAAPEYDVTEIVGPAREETDVTRKAGTTNESLSPIETKTQEYDSFDMRNVMAYESNVNHENIEAVVTFDNI